MNISAIQAHLTKYESLMPSLALILHLADGFTGPVSVQSAAKAADWCEYLESHARRIYGCEILAEARAANLLAKKIQAGKIEDGGPCMAGSTKKSGVGLDKKTSELALLTLEQCGWLRVERVPTGGKPAHIIRLNPYLELATDDQ